ncbi:MAG: cyclic nucleotide-binding domain-containing protein [Caldilineaceae bacterium]|nr:cyclic nucleotide-binding domain-containing protein [Caldilineaceae bacterium]
MLPTSVPGRSRRQLTPQNLSPNAGIDPAQDAMGVILQRLAAWGIPADDAAYALQGGVRWRELAPRQYLFTQDTPVTAIYLLMEGQIYQEQISPDSQGNRRVTLRREAQPGEWLGHYDMLYTQRYGTRARAVESSRLIEVQAAALNRLLYRYPRVRQQIAPMEKIGRLRTVPLFGSLDLTALSYVADACRAERIPENTILYTADQPAEDLFIVDQGQVLFSGEDYPWVGVGNGMAFGFHDRRAGGRNADAPPYAHIAKTSVPSTVFIISRRQLLDLTDLVPEVAGNALRQQAEEALAAVTVFANYTPEQRRALLAYMSHYYIPIHHLLMQQGEVGDSLWILTPGSRATLFALEGGQALHPTPIYGPNFFGELALRVDHTLNSTVQAEPGSQWLRLHQSDFRTFLSHYGQNLQGELTLSPDAERYLGRAEERKRYPWLQVGENLVLFQHRHPLALLRNIAFSLILSTVILVVWLNVAGQAWLAPWLLWVFGVLGVISLLQFGWGLMDYLNDYLLVTNQRLVRQEKVLFISEYRQAAFLEQIRNIDVEVDFLGNLLRYGELRIQTAATSGSIDFDFVPDPIRVKQTILEQQNLRQQHYQASNKMVIQNILEERFGLRLRLPQRVIPVSTSPTIQLAHDLKERLHHLFDIQSYLVMRTDERVIWRKHWFVLLGRALGPLATLITVAALLIGEQLLPPALQQFVLPINIIFVLLGLWAMGWLAWVVADWRNDTYEVDAKQIADVEKKPLFFSEQRRTALLGEIENIEVSIPSPLHYLLNFGNVRLSTAAAQGVFSFDWVPDPRGVSEEVRRRIEVYRYQQETNRARQRAQELPDWFEMYNRLGGDNIAPQQRPDG